ncbi:MAG: alginate lyase family protein [Bryobacteraceae bacterium]
MRSSRELAFRLKQEIRNLELFAFPPTLDLKGAPPLANLPGPEVIAEELQSTDFTAEVLRIADQIIAHRFPLLGVVLETGSTIEWRRDYANQISTVPRYFRLIPYLDLSRVGDHKIICELNRHQHLVLLAQAFLFTGREIYMRNIFDQLNTWWRQNPYQRGINWTSALEVAFRAFSWIWLHHFIGDHMPGDLRSRFLESLYQHGCYIENNLSLYFSPNTHLLGEAVVLHALGHFFLSFPRADHWLELGNQTVLQQLDRQVRPDGSHFEQSTYYHVYALDMFLFHAIVSHPAREYMEALARMADFLHALLGPARSLPFLGDDDGGRWFHPYGPRDQFGRATLATCATFLGRKDWTFERCDLFPQAAWWLGRTQGSSVGEYTSRVFPDAGLAVLQTSSNRVVFDAGLFGPGPAGHSHSDSLGIVATGGDTPILVDSGTYTYVEDQWRNAFRGSSSHNTVRVDRRDQAIPLEPFRWSNPPAVALITSVMNTAGDAILGECKYGGITHRRFVTFVKPNFVFILDCIAGPPGDHELEQFWHLASSEVRNRVSLASPAEECETWHSPVFGEKRLAPSLIVRKIATLPAHFAAALILNGIGTFTITEQPHSALFEWSDGQNRRLFEFAWPAAIYANPNLA